MLFGDRRTLHMVAQMNEESVGNCTNIGECTEYALRLSLSK